MRERSNKVGRLREKSLLLSKRIQAADCRSLVEDPLPFWQLFNIPKHSYNKNWTDKIQMAASYYKQWQLAFRYSGIEL